MAGEDLTELEQRILLFEKQWWGNVSVKHDVIRQDFDMSPTLYFQKLNVLLDKPAAMVFDPVLVKALLRRREGEF